VVLPGGIVAYVEVELPAAPLEDPRDHALDVLAAHRLELPGADGKGAARLAFRLGNPTASHPDVFVAMENRQARDLTGLHGLVFSIKGDGVYRIWVQARDKNPASSDDGMEFWFASVRTSTEWQRIAVPFSTLRSINKRTDGRLDLDKVVSIVFVMDKGADKPGTSGTIWIDDIGIY